MRYRGSGDTEKKAFRPKKADIEIGRERERAGRESARETRRDRESERGGRAESESERDRERWGER